MSYLINVVNNHTLSSVRCLMSITVVFVTIISNIKGEISIILGYLKHLQLLHFKHVLGLLTLFL